LKRERWGSPLVQEKYQEEMPVTGDDNITIIIIIIIITTASKQLGSSSSVPVPKLPESLFPALSWLALCNIARRA